MEGNLIGIFGTDSGVKSAFAASIAKKSEVEGIIVYHKNESGRRFSLLDDAQYPERIQGYSRIASLSDYVYYVVPSGGKLTPPDGELAVLADSFSLNGSIQVIDSANFTREMAQSTFKGLRLANYEVEQRNSQSSIIDLSRIKPSEAYPRSGTLVYIDRAFNVKGVGLVVLGFILCGEVHVHDKLRPIPGEKGKTAEVKGIQVSDEDYETAGRGIRVGLSLRGIELKDLTKTSWLDDGSLPTASKLTFDFRQSPYFKQPVAERDLHLQAPGELLVAKITQGSSKTELQANLQSEAPVWNGMKVALVDLNAKSLRIAGGGICKL